MFSQALLFLCFCQLLLDEGSLGLQTPERSTSQWSREMWTPSDQSSANYFTRVSVSSLVGWGSQYPPQRTDDTYKVLSPVPNNRTQVSPRYVCHAVLLEPINFRPVHIIMPFAKLHIKHMHGSTLVQENWVILLTCPCSIWLVLTGLCQTMLLLV